MSKSFFSKMILENKNFIVIQTYKMSLIDRLRIEHHGVMGAHSEYQPTITTLVKEINTCLICCIIAPWIKKNKSCPAFTTVGFRFVDYKRIPFGVHAVEIDSADGEPENIDIFTHVRIRMWSFDFDD